MIHGLTSPDGGFYVVKDAQGDVLAQCWAWRSKAGAIVFDSIEVPDKKAANEAAKSLFNQMAQKMVDEKYTHKVACGATSGISEQLGTETKWRERLVDYSGYADSGTQRIIIDSNRPYLQYGVQGNESKTVPFINKIMGGEKIDENTDFIEMITWAVLENKSELINEIKESAKINGTDEKVSKIIDTISDYLQKEESRFDILSKIEDVPYVAKLVDYSNGKTALICAAEKGLGEVVLKLIEMGVNVDEKDNEGKTALICAAKKGLGEVVLKLMKKGPNVDVKDNTGTTALMYVINNRDTNIALKLIEKGANVDVKDNNGQTALMWALASGDTDVVLKLMEKGAKLNEDEYNDGKTVLIWAIEYDPDVALKLIEKGVKLDEKDNEGKTALMWALASGDTDVALNLIEKGANINEKDIEGKMALMHAIENSHTDLALTLIGMGENVNEKDNGGLTVLDYASPELAKLMLDKVAEREKNKLAAQNPTLVFSSRGPDVQLKNLIKNHKNNHVNQALDSNFILDNKKPKP